MTKTTTEQKKLLLLLLIGIVVAIPYFFFIRPQMELSDELRREIISLKERQIVLEGYRQMMPQYQLELAEMEVTKNEIFSRYPSELPQEATILFIDGTEKSIPMNMRQVGFAADALAMLVSPDYAVPYLEVMEIASTTALIEGLDAIANSTTLTFSCSYESFKKFLRHVAEYDNRLVIPTLSASLDADTLLITGNFTLDQFAISGEARDKVLTDEPIMRLGVLNIFDGQTSQSGQSSQRNQNRQSNQSDQGNQGSRGNLSDTSVSIDIPLHGEASVHVSFPIP